MKIEVLGTEYTIYLDVEPTEMPDDTNGLTDPTTKEIKVVKLTGGEKDSVKNLEFVRNRILRHEIIHAFLYESGLNHNSFTDNAWATNEEIVDWIAIQFPKINSVFNRLKINCF